MPPNTQKYKLNKAINVLANANCTWNNAHKCQLTVAINQVDHILELLPCPGLTLLTQDGEQLVQRDLSIPVHVDVPERPLIVSSNEEPTNSIMVMPNCTYIKHYLLLLYPCS